MDNLSVVIISFKNFTRFLESIEPQQGIGSQQRNRSQIHMMPDSVTPMQVRSPVGQHDQIHSSQPNIGSSNQVAQSSSKRHSQVNNSQQVASSPGGHGINNLQYAHAGGAMGGLATNNSRRSRYANVASSETRTQEPLKVGKQASGSLTSDVYTKNGAASKGQQLGNSQHTAIAQSPLNNQNEKVTALLSRRHI